MGKLSHLKKAVTEAKRRVYQGSPHKYDGKLDHSKIGTGEGAQAYGYGHYLAENPDVAGTYRNVNTEMLIDGKPFDDMRASGFDGLDELAVLALRARNGNVDEAIKYAESSIDKGIADQLRKFDRSRLKVNEGHLYEFDLPESAIDNMLDWDAPLSEQSENVKRSIEGLISALSDNDFGYAKGPTKGRLKAFVEGRDVGVVATGEDLYRALADYGGYAREGSEIIKGAGIPGIKYHDGMSRAAGEGTRNFVIFPGNEDMVKAVSRNGEKLSAAALAPLAGIGLMGTFSEDSQAGVGGTIKAAGKALDMSDIARAQRAADEGDITVALDPTNIRSVNAAFDPAKKDSADLLASLGGAGVLGAATLSPEDARAAELEAIALYGEPERGWRPTEKRNKWKQFKQQYVEPLGTIASSLASLPVSGLEGLGALAQGYGIDDAVGAMERRQAAMTYVPGSESGRQSLANIGEAMEILGEAPPVRMATDALDHGADVAYRYGSKVHPKVGAAFGATVKTLPEVIF